MAYRSRLNFEDLMAYIYISDFFGEKTWMNFEDSFTMLYSFTFVGFHPFSKTSRMDAYMHDMTKKK